jgi:phosphatidylserine/phosphatidylglycerophosphate/cardiolipin synthase-like enzyme
MHAKFALVESPGQRRAIFGSFNWTEPSRRMNREIGAICGDAKLFDALAQRWEVLEAQASGPALR